MPSLPGQPTFQGQEYLISDASVEHEPWQIDPTQTVLGNGDILVAWETAERTDEHPASEIDARILLPDGTVWSPELVLEINTQQTFGPLSIQTLPNGDALVNGQWVLDASGHVTPPPANVPAPQPTLLSNGNELVTSVVVTPDFNVELHGHIVDPASGAAGPDFVIGNPNFEVIGDADSVTALADGRAVVTWGTDTGIEARVINADGSMDNPFVVSSTPNAAGRFPHVTELPNGEILVTWSSTAGGDLDIHGRTFSLDHTISGTTDNDVLHGTDGADDIYGAAGNDTINGGAGNDTLSGGSGHNFMWGQDGNDTFLGGSGTDAFAGGNGIDTVRYEQSTAGVTVNLATGTASGGDAAGDSFTSIENLTGSTHNDALTGDAGANRLDGNAGDDRIWGGDGNDTLIGGHGADVLAGGQGNDTVDYSTSLSAVTVNLATGTGSGGDAQGDKLSSIENVTGSGFDDHLTGNAVANQIFGGGGADILTGGAGADTFVFKAILDSAPGHEDQITDFSSAQGDHISLVGIDANTKVAGDQAFNYIGSTAFSDVAGQLRYADHFLEGDVNGDGIADFRVQVNVASLSHSDLLV